MEGTHSMIGGRINRIHAGVDASSIAGGWGNTINPGGSCSFIAGGLNNVVAGAYSSILGGSGNNDNGLPYTGMFGCNLNAVTRGCAFWANELIVPDMPDQSVAAGLPSGALYYCNTTNVVYRRP